MIGIKKTIKKESNKNKKDFTISLEDAQKKISKKTKAKQKKLKQFMLNIPLEIDAIWRN